MEKNEKDEKFSQGFDKNKNPDFHSGFQPPKFPKEDDALKSVIDTIPQEEMDKARTAFNQFKYIDTVNSSYKLQYNLFIPENYTKKKKISFNYFYS